MVRVMSIVSSRATIALETVHEVTLKEAMIIPPPYLNIGSIELQHPMNASVAAHAPGDGLIFLNGGLG